jgi:uncharacterized membrane protein
MFSLAEIHPVAVHFPIVLFLSLAAFDTIMVARGATLSGRSGIANLSAGLALLSGVAAIVAYLFGDLAYDIAISSGIAESKLETHEALGTWTAMLLVVWAALRSYFWWRGSTLANKGKRVIVGIELAGALLVVTTAYFGGQLVYELGVNVARAGGG